MKRPNDAFKRGSAYIWFDDYYIYYQDEEATLCANKACLYYDREKGICAELVLQYKCHNYIKDPDGTIWVMPLCGDDPAGICRNFDPDGDFIANAWMYKISEIILLKEVANIINK